MDFQLPIMLARGQLGNGLPNSLAVGTAYSRLNLKVRLVPCRSPNRRTAPVMTEPPSSVCTLSANLASQV